MDVEQLLLKLFPNGYTIESNEDHVIAGVGKTQHVDFTFIGLHNKAELDPKRSLKMAFHVLNLIENHPKRPLCLLIDTAGQKVSHQAELLSLHRYFGLLIKTLYLARQLGHLSFAIVFGNALGGAFIATGLNANFVYALPDSHIAVMWLEAMARVTKIPLDKLKSLSNTSPYFAPGAENFMKLGAVEAIVDAEEVMKACLAGLSAPYNEHHWREQGASRNGRTLAHEIVMRLQQ